MSFITTIEPERAAGDVAGLYDRLARSAGYLPNYARVFCHRPGVMTAMSQLQQAVATTMAPRLWALVAMAVAREIHSSYCSLAYARRLLSRYVTESELLDILNGSAGAPLSEAERAAMELAVKVARDSSAVNQSDIDRLRRAGFDDAQVFDVVAAAGYRCLFAKVADALGALPDAPLGELTEDLLGRLVVGRQVDTEQRSGVPVTGAAA